MCTLSGKSVANYVQNWHAELHVIAFQFCVQISIWDERKVFGSRGQILKEEFVGKHPEDNNKNGRHVVSKLVSEICMQCDSHSLSFCT